MNDIVKLLWDMDTCGGFQKVGSRCVERLPKYLSQLCGFAVDESDRVGGKHKKRLDMNEDVAEGSIKNWAASWRNFASRPCLSDSPSLQEECYTTAACLEHYYEKQLLYVENRAQVVRRSDREEDYECRFIPGSTTIPTYVSWAATHLQDHLADGPVNLSDLIHVNVEMSSGWSSERFFREVVCEFDMYEMKYVPGGAQRRQVWYHGIGGRKVHMMQLMGLTIHSSCSNSCE